MDDLLQIRRRIDRDMKSRMQPHLYRKASDNELHIRRIRACIDEVNARDGAGVHLEFCITGYPHNKDIYLCAVWPRDIIVQYHFREERTIRELARFLGRVICADKFDPPFVLFDLGGRSSSHFRRYVFFTQDPHQPHRPYHFSDFDEQLSQEGRDDYLVLQYHQERLLQKWREKQERINNAFFNVDIERLAKLHEVLARF